MWEKKRSVVRRQPRCTSIAYPCASRYHELFFMIDTCQANTMYSKIYSPNVLATGSSKKDQNSYSVSRYIAPSTASRLTSPITASYRQRTWHCHVGSLHVGDLGLYGKRQQDLRSNHEELGVYPRTLRPCLACSYFPTSQFDSYDPVRIHSNPGVRTDLFRRPLDSVRITDFLGGVARVELTMSGEEEPLV